MVAAASPAAGGIWTYGCKGSLGDDEVIFDRNSLVLLPRRLPSGDIRELVKHEVAIFEAADENSGLKQTMQFARGSYNQKVTLTEVSSRKTSEHSGRVGSGPRYREETTVTFRRRYRFVRTGGPEESPPRDIVMDCVDYELTAP